MRNRHIVNIVRAVQYRERDKLIDMCEKSAKSDLVAALGVLSMSPEGHAKFLRETIAAVAQERRNQTEKAE